MLFKDDDHKEFYIQNVRKTNCSNDNFRKALFYALGLTEETRNHVKDLYDFKEGLINPDGLQKPWQTGTSMKVTRLAFNLYNGFAGDGIDNRMSYTPYELFATPPGLMVYMLEAVKVLYLVHPEMEVK